MAPKLGFLIAVVFAVAATHDVRAFMPPGRAAPSWRATTAGRRHTCSAADSRDIRPATAVHASTTGDNADALATAAAGSSNAEGQEESGVRRWAGIRRSLARGAVSFTAVTLGATALSGLSAEIQQRLGGAVAMPMAMGSAEASVVKPFSKRSVEEKLGNLPAFMVTNAKGSPYLTPTGREGHQLAVFFTNLDDAKEMLREMVQSDTYAKDARILVVSMEKAYGMVKAGPRSTGFANDGSQEEFMDFKLERDMHSVPKARKLGLDLDPSAAETPIPIFYAEGLQMKRDGSMVSPLFMDPADLVTAWKKASAKNPDMPEKPVVKVLNFPEVIVAMEISDDLKDFGFFASTESADFIRQGREMTKGHPKPRLSRTPF